MSVDDPSLGRQMAKGAAWMVLLRVSVRLIGFISTVIVARLLVPEDFGIIAMAMIVVGFVEIFSETYLDLALIRQTSGAEAYYDTAWTLKILQGTILATVIFFAAPYASEYFDEPRLTLVIQVLAARTLLLGLENIGVVAFRQELNYEKDFRFNLYKRVLTLCFVIPLAIVLRNYWALVAGMVFAAFAGVLLSYAMHPYRPRFAIRNAETLLPFSGWMLVWSVGNFVRRKADQFVVGSIAGTTFMGRYYMASEISAMSTIELALPMGRAIFPGLAKISAETDQFKAATIGSFGIIVMLLLPVGFGVSAVSEDFVTVVLGEKWQPIVPFLQWLVIAGVASALSYSLYNALFVVGRADFVALESWLHLFAAAVAIGLAAYFGGIREIAVARTLVAVSVVPLTIYLVTRACPISIKQILGVLWRPVAASLVMVLAVRTFHNESIQTPFLTLAMDTFLGVTVYLGALLILWRLAGRPQGPELAVAAYIGDIIDHRKGST